MTLPDKAAELLRLHLDPELLVLVNAWDVISATIVAGLPGCRAIATASHSIAASHGYLDGEQIPLDEMITAIGRIAAAVDLPVTADLEAGYGDVGTTVRRAIGVGVVGANIEDAENFNSDVIKSFKAPFKANAGIAVLRGNLAPRGAIIKPSAATPALMTHRGRAVVFDSIDEFHKTIDDESLEIDETCVMVLRNCGPKG